ncbi:MAG: glycosyltransferase family 39 protein [Sporomusaceae bacterium]|nr:glycosyltransferase family 39 protein [Sporomusaceae bacterium]
MRLGIKLFFLLVIIANIAYNATLPLHPDEAYYWQWSQHLALSYYDHPPMAAYAIWLAARLGDSETVLRLAAVAAMTGAAWLVWRTGCLLFNRRTGELALLVYLLVPLTQVGYLAVTPDPFLSFFWALALYLVCRGLFKPQAGCLALAGAAIGCALLSKYTAILLPAALLLAGLSSARCRRLLYSRELLPAALLAALVFTPVVIWNATHDWVSFRYQFAHGVAAEKVLQPVSFAEFFAGQALVSNPFFFFPLLIYLAREKWRSFREPQLAILTWPFLFTLLFFGYNALYKKAELNWAMPAMISGSILLSHWLLRTGKTGLLRWGAAFTLLAVLVFKGPELVPLLPEEFVMKQKFLGYRELFAGSDLRGDAAFAIGDNYGDAASIAYYLSGRPPVYILEPQPLSQYHFWRGGLAGMKGADAVWIGEEQPSAAVVAAFKRVEFDRTLLYENRFGIKRYQVFRCQEFQGLNPANE